MSKLFFVTGSSSSVSYSWQGNGVNQYMVNTDENANIHFGNGATEVPFSLGAFIKMVDATRFRVIWHGATSANNSEYGLYTDGADFLRISTFDASTGARRDQVSNATLTAFQNTWISVIGTSNGSGTFVLYVNGAAVASTFSTSGAYTAMEVLANNVFIGALGGGIIGGDYSNGKITQPFFADKVLSAVECAEFHALKMGQLSTLSWAGNIITGCRFVNGQADYPFMTDQFDSNDFNMQNGVAADINTDVPV